MHWVLHVPYVSTYATLSHLKDDLLTNQQQLKLKQLTPYLRDWSIRHRLNVKVLRRFLHTVARWWNRCRYTPKIRSRLAEGIAPFGRWGWKVRGVFQLHSAWYIPVIKALTRPLKYTKSKQNPRSTKPLRLSLSTKKPSSRVGLRLTLSQPKDKK